MSRAHSLLPLFLGLGCAKPTLDPQEAAINDLARIESAKRASIDWAKHPSSDRTLGPDPIDLVSLPDGRIVVALRGTDELMLADDSGKELARVKAPRAPRALAIHEGRIFAAGELSPEIAEYTVSGSSLSLTQTMHTGAKGHRGVAFHDGRLLALGVDGVLRSAHRSGDGVLRGTHREYLIGALAFGVKAVRNVIVSMSVADHRVVILRGDERHEVRNDGPFWGFAIRAVGDDVLIAAGHVEDHPLERSDGSFAYIDSFVRVVRLSDGALEPIALVNTSEHGVITPKGMAFLDDHTLAVTGAGSPAMAILDLSRDAPVVSVQPWLPGTSALVATPKLIATSPLLDALIVDGRMVPIVHEPRSEASRLGEALVFTYVMAPRQKSDGKRSRFTCEACHFEGTIDGRTHRTGRGDIVATTRPLWGLANNIPLFTRALDPNLSEMVHAEFRVANAHSGLDPWFALTVQDAPWLLKETKSPMELRRALVEFLFDFTPRTNVNAISATAIEGAEVFRARCASCHAPRLVGDDPQSEVPFEKWRELILSENGPITWTSPERRKTGVEPYVHPEGARSSSLRRLAWKRPYFTTGFAKDLDDVLDAIKFDGPALLHFSDRDLPGLADDEKRALRAFLDLL